MTTLSACTTYTDLSLVLLPAVKHGDWGERRHGEEIGGNIGERGCCKTQCFVAASFLCNFLIIFSIFIAFGFSASRPLGATQ